MGRFWVFVAGVAAAVGCGGKEHSAAGEVVGTGADAGRGPAPSCGAICAHVIGSCAPGASADKCNTDCEGTRAQFTNCPYQLDAYLRCMATTDVECKQGDVVIVGCSFERDSLESCQH